MSLLVAAHNKTEPSVNDGTSSGLFYVCAGSAPAPLNLVSVDVCAEVIDVNVKVTVTQCFNTDGSCKPTSESPVDLLFMFPLVESSAVTSFSSDINGTSTTARMENKQTSSGSSVAKPLPESLENTFMCSVGRISSQSVIKMVITYSTMLATDASGEKLLLIPRQAVPSCASSSLLNLTLKMTMAADVEKVVCRTHPSLFRFDTNRHRVDAKGVVACNALDKDVIIGLTMKQSDKAHCIFEVNPLTNEATCSLSLPCAFLDLASATGTTSEYVFILDCSGSMSWSLDSSSSNACTLRNIALKQEQHDLIAYESAKAANEIKHDECFAKFASLKEMLGLSDSERPCMYKMANSQFNDLTQIAAMNQDKKLACEIMFKEFVCAWTSYDCSDALMRSARDECKVSAQNRIACDQAYKATLKTSNKTRIACLKSAMHLILKSLPDRSRFQILCFGDEYRALFQNGAVAYEEGSLSQASEFVRNLTANMNGTNLLKPLESVLRTQSESYRSVFVITDGMVGNIEQITSIVASNVGNTRVFSIGIGSEASPLCQSLARAGHGDCVLITEDISASLVEMVQIAMQPSLTNISVDWGQLQSKGDLQLQQCPAVPPAIVPGTRLGTYALNCNLSQAVLDRVKSHQLVNDFDSQISVTAWSSLTNKPMKFEIGPSVVCYGNVVAPLAARAGIDELEQLHSSSACSAASISARIAIQKLSQKHGVPSREASLVFGLSQQQHEIKSIRGPHHSSSITASSSKSYDQSHKAKKAAPVSSGSDFDQLVDLQTASGLWKLNEKTVSLVRRIDMAVGDRLAALLATAQDDADIKASEALLEILQTKFGDRESTWSLLAAKANFWIRAKKSAKKTHKARDDNQKQVDHKIATLEANITNTLLSDNKRKRAQFELQAMRDSGLKTSEEIAASQKPRESIKRQKLVM